MTNFPHDSRGRCLRRGSLVYRCAGVGKIASEDRLIAPDLVMAEIASALWKAVRFAHLAPATAAEAMVAAGAAFHELVSARMLADRALAIALDLRHPVYDCFYLALAEARGSRLVTADDRLLRVCARTPFAKLVRSL